MQAIVFGILLLLSGCVTIPRDEVIKPQLSNTSYCVHVDFTRFREGPISRKVEEFPLEKSVEATYRLGLRKFGIETECSQPIANFEFNYIVRGGVKIPSFDLLLSTISLLTLGIVPSKTDMVIDLTYIRKNGGVNKNNNYLVPITQWTSLFLIPKEISQKKEARDIYNIPNYWDVVIVGKTAEIILKELSGVNTYQRVKD